VVKEACCISCGASVFPAAGPTLTASVFDGEKYRRPVGRRALQSFQNHRRILPVRRMNPTGPGVHDAGIMTFSRILPFMRENSLYLHTKVGKMFL
jgi:hypothetical protein